MATNDTFVPLRKSTKVKNLQPVEVVQYWAGAGNNPRKYSFSVTLLKSNAGPGIVGQRFVATEDALKAIGIPIQTEKFQPQFRTGTIRLQLYEWTDETHITPVPGGIVQVDASFVTDLDETVFEFDDSIDQTIGGDPIVGQEYFFTLTLDDGYVPKNPINIARNTAFMPDGEAYQLANDGVTWRKIEPFTNIVFQTYKSIASLAVEVVGPKGKSLSDIYDALTTGTEALLPEYGTADFLKPFAHDTAGDSAHGNLYIDNTSPTPSKIGNAGTIAGNWSDVSDLVVTLTKHFDLVVIETTQRIRVDWGNTDYDTLDCSSNFALLQEGDVFSIEEVVDTLNFRLHASGDTPPELSITVWKIVPPDDEEPT